MRADNFDESNRRNLPEHWRTALRRLERSVESPSTDIVNPSLQVTCSRDDIALPAYIALALSGPKVSNQWKTRHNVKRFRKELADHKRGLRNV